MIKIRRWQRILSRWGPVLKHAGPVASALLTHLAPTSKVGPVFSILHEILSKSLTAPPIDRSVYEQLRAVHLQVVELDPTKDRGKLRVLRNKQDQLLNQLFKPPTTEDE